ncbi:MAG: murein biosynthesis integral membrane protein MurJ [Actinomycetota bacterium]|nr:murein biosynthesis integral membrane protein MurJ [Actinomycetota bacterium]
MSTTERRAVRLGRSTVVMATGTALSRITGLGRVIALAFALGVTESRLADSYNIANTMPNVIYELILGGVLTSVFIPVVVQELKTRRRDEAWEAISALATTSLLVLIVLSVIAALVAPWIVRLFTLRLSGVEATRQQETATFFLRVFAPQIALYGLAAVATALLNAHDKFAVPMFAPVLNNLVLIGTCLAFAAVVSGTPTNASVGNSLGEKLLLGVGTTAGVAVMALAIWLFVWRLPGRLRFRPDFRHPAVHKLARLSAWTLGYVAVNQIGFGIALYLANGVQGGPTAFFTAFAFFQLPYGIVAVSIMTALVPTLAASHVDGDDTAFGAWLTGGIRAMAVVLVPATAAYLVLSRPLVQTLLQHGVMGAASTSLVSEVLDMFSLGLLPFSAFLLFLRAFYARQDARTPLGINVVANAVYIVFSLLLFSSLEIRGLALAHSLSYVVAASVGGVLLWRSVGGLDLGHTMTEIAKVVAATAVATAAMLGARELIGGAMGAGGLRAFTQLTVGGGLGALIYLGAARALGVEELGMLRRLLPGSRSPRASEPEKSR